MAPKYFVDDVTGSIEVGKSAASADYQWKLLRNIRELTVRSYGRNRKRGLYKETAVKGWKYQVDILLITEPLGFLYEVGRWFLRLAWDYVCNPSRVPLSFIRREQEVMRLPSQAGCLFLWGKAALVVKGLHMQPFFILIRQYTARHRGCCSVYI